MKFKSKKFILSSTLIGGSLLPLLAVSCQTVTEKSETKEKNEETLSENVVESTPNNENDNKVEENVAESGESDESHEKTAEKAAEAGKSDESREKSQQDADKSEQKLKIATWNIQTFGGERTVRQSPRYYAVLETLKHIDADIYALQEIVKNGGDKKATNLAEDLNKFEETKTDNRNTWEIQTLLSENPNKKGQAEYFAFLYKSNKVSATNLRLFLDTENSIDFSRPPLLADFQLLNSKDKFTLGTFHLDAPGAKKGKEEASAEFSGQGEQEVKEAIGLTKIFETFKAENATGDLIIMGDSNIKDDHSEKIFQSDAYVNLNVKTGYRDFANNLKNYRTTFSGQGWKENQGNNNYKNSYDKFLILDQGPTNVELAQPEEYRVNIADAFLPSDKGGYLDKTLASEYYIQVRGTEKYKDANSVPISTLLSNFTDHAPAVIFYTYTISDNK